MFTKFIFQIINNKIVQLNGILATTEKDGVTSDLYGANIIHARIDRLQKIKTRKIAELKNMNIPNKYIHDLEKYKIKK